MPRQELGRQLHVSIPHVVFAAKSQRAVEVRRLGEHDLRDAWWCLAGRNSASERTVQRSPPTHAATACQSSAGRMMVMSVGSAREQHCSSMTHIGSVADPVKCNAVQHLDGRRAIFREQVRRNNPLCHSSTARTTPTLVLLPLSASDGMKFHESRPNLAGSMRITQSEAYMFARMPSSVLHASAHQPASDERTRH